MKNILVTGCNGKLGKKIMETYCQDWRINGIDKYCGESDKNNVFTCDLKNYNDLTRYTENVEIIIHTAGLHAINIESRSRLDFFEENVVSTENLLESAYINTLMAVFKPKNNFFWNITFCQIITLYIF